MVVIGRDVLNEMYSVSLGQIGCKLSKSCFSNYVTTRQSLTAVAD